MFEAEKKSALSEITALHEGRQLSEGDEISRILPSGSSAVLLASGALLPPGQVALSFRFPSAPVCNLPLPSDSRMSFVLMMICCLAFITFSELLFGSDFNAGQRLIDFVSSHSNVLKVHSSLIRVDCFDFQNEMQLHILLDFVPLCDRIFDLKHRLLKIIRWKEISHCQIRLEMNGLPLPNNWYLSQVGSKEVLKLRLALREVSVFKF
jgi:hypothetical protein